MNDHHELEWLRDHGVRIDHKGRIIVSLPAPEAQVEFLRDELEPTIAELMRRDVNHRIGGSRGRRRRRASRPTVKPEKRAQLDDTAQPSRIGRPVIGSEARVYVQTSIAQSTRQILAERGVTLADVFDQCARELAYAS
jgi:hypothetical protein